MPSQTAEIKLHLSLYRCPAIYTDKLLINSCRLWTWKQLQGFKGQFGDKEQKFSKIKRNPYVTEVSLQVSSLEIQEIMQTKLVVQNPKCRFKKALAIIWIHNIWTGKQALFILNSFLHFFKCRKADYKREGKHDIGVF